MRRLNPRGLQTRRAYVGRLYGFDGYSYITEHLSFECCSLLTDAWAITCTSPNQLIQRRFWMLPREVPRHRVNAPISAMIGRSQVIQRQFSLTQLYHFILTASSTLLHLQPATLRHDHHCRIHLLASSPPSVC